MLLLMHLVVSCTSLSLTFDGFHAAVYVNTRGYNAEYIASAKSELIAYVESLGLKKTPPGPHHVQPPEYVNFRHPKDPVVFYNLYLDDLSMIDITIRDVRRTFSGSEELRGEIERLLKLLREMFGQDNVTFKQRSNFPKMPGW